MSNLYQDAILDAKALRASAMANAKAALEEAFEPKIQEMISKHLSEEAVEEEIEEGYGMEEEGKMHGDQEKMEEADINEAELEEILNQLEEMSTPQEESLNEAEEEGEEEEEDGGEKEGEEEAVEGEEEVSDETKIIDITLGDLKQVIQSLMPGKEMPDAEEDAKEEPTADSEAEEEVSLEEIISELENEGMETSGHYDAPDVNPATVPAGSQTEEGTMDESAMSNVILALTSILAIPGVTALLVRKFGKGFVDDLKRGGGVALKGQPLDTTPTAGDEPMNEGTIEESAMSNVMLALSAVIGIPGVAAYLVRRFGQGFVDQLKKDKGVALQGQPLDTDTSMGAQNELAQAKATIAELRKDLQEVNLLNAKYLYMNKLFKAKSLTESQKLKVINTLDRATTVKEVKTAYEIMNESFSIQKGQLKESVGFASKPAGVAPKANIVESEQFISRWQKLAGIKK